MRPGKVVTIRVNPTDCLAVLDVVRKAGIDTESHSFAQLVSLSHSILLQSAKDALQIPERQGYEYEQEMQPWLHEDRSKRKAKLAKTNAIHLQGSEFKAPSLTPFSSGGITDQVMDAGERVYSQHRQTPPAETQRAAAGATPVMSKEMAGHELTRLIQKKDMAEDGRGVWTPHDQQLYDQCYNIIYPEG